MPNILTALTSPSVVSTTLTLIAQRVAQFRQDVAISCSVSMALVVPFSEDSSISGRFITTKAVSAAAAAADTPRKALLLIPEPLEDLLSCDSLLSGVNWLKSAFFRLSPHPSYASHLHRSVCQTQNGLAKYIRQPTASLSNHLPPLQKSLFHKSSCQVARAFYCTGCRYFGHPWLTLPEQI